MAEQEKYGSHWGSGANNPTSEPIPIPVPKGSGAEQDRWGGHFSSGTTSKEIPIRVPTGSGAEQDRWSAHLSRSDARNPEAHGWNIPVWKGSGAEQDRYAAHWSPSEPRNPEAHGIKVPVWTTSGAEQDRYASHWSPSEANNPTTSRIGIPIRRPVGAGPEQEIYDNHFNRGVYSIPRNATAVGLLQDTLLPSLGFHTGLSVVAYTASRVANRVDGKDWLWPTGQVANAWWSAVGTRVLYDGLPIGTALSSLVYPDKVLLAAVTAWGTRLFYQVATRSAKSGEDDARYVDAKKEPGFWNKAFFKMFLPEAIAQTIISLPFTLPFRNSYASARSSLAAPLEWAQDLAVFVFSTGFALEVLADTQLNSHKKTNDAHLNRSGVWSIVRHPNYLGDALVHISFPLFLWASGKVHPAVLLAPVANYAFLRYVGGDAENEASQTERYSKAAPIKAQELAEYKREKNGFWPKVQEATNPWALGVLGAGAAGLTLERVIRHFALKP